MAEYCFECRNEMHKNRYTEDDFIISKHLDLCEGFGKLKHVIVVPRDNIDSSCFALFDWPFEMLLDIIDGICYLIELMKRKSKKNRK